MNGRPEATNRLLTRGLASFLLGWIPDRAMKRGSAILFVVLIVGSWVFVLWEAQLDQLLTPDNLQRGYRFVNQLFNVGSETAFRSPEAWGRAAELSYDTLLMSVLAIGMATLGMLFLVVPGARATANGTITLGKTLPGQILFLIIRALFIFTRAVPELFWAMLIIFVFEPGIFGAALALAIHNFGILGKLCAEVVEDLNLAPITALRTSGAGLFQILLVGVLPQVLPKFLTYILYRWEDIIRTTIVVGFVAAGGLGHQFRLSMSWFHYDVVGQLLLCYLVLVILVELVSGALRGLAKL